MTRSTEFLYEYFVHNNEKDGISFNRIKRVLEGIEPQTDENKFLKYIPLYNLLKYGLIELVGKHTYGLSPSILIKGRDCNLGINFPKITDESVIESLLGLKVIYNSMAYLENDIAQPFEFRNVVRAIPDIRSIIGNSFKEWAEGPEDCESIECYTATGWRNSKIEGGTLFKVRIGSNQFLFKYIVKLSGAKYFQFEAPEFEKFNLAVMLHSINGFSHIKGLEYNSNSQILKTTAYGFPIILERLLFINHILETGKISLSREYHLSRLDFKCLNKIFHHKINKI
ncbi:hypothetical protein [Dyadobacter psychrotolerans]|uniref:Uncharacterized protein n=1 Tax=Dyadobacter psychrotolerans TaxID=2541721 RepID=A0A4R5DMP6_9BACT|nr:hypothetical protein [Dyadobacter psychrotolerans]TDE14787.1 hypothetical protein E0F88_16505 [Dyadobacter psychrotolerans]